MRRDPAELTLGTDPNDLAHVHYCWRPYENRDPEARSDYDRLREHMRVTGELVNPLIVFQNHVLVGQRRCEIAQQLGWARVPCWEILEDITADPTPDRVLALRDLYYPVEY